MSAKKWLAVFFVTAAAVLLCAAAWNIVIDPFGVFGDRFFNWYEYDMTMNPRVAKIAYLDRHFDRYDSYIIGSSKASSLSPARLNEYMDASFYNMTWYGGDLADERLLTAYILEHYTVKNIVLTVDPQDTQIFDIQADPMKGNMHCRVDGSPAAAFYARYLFANPGYGLDKLRAYAKRGYLTSAASVYVAETGVYNKQLRDASRIGDMAAYLDFEDSSYTPTPSAMPYLREALQAVSDIAAMCRDAGVSLTVIAVPLYKDDLLHYDRDTFTQYREGLAAIHDLYDFWDINCVTADLRYFYSVNHFRNDVGNMVLACIFGDDQVWTPENFGRLTTPDNASAHAASPYDSAGAPLESYTAKVPILMYHSLTGDPAAVSPTVTLAADFDGQMAALKKAGYSAISYQDLVDFVDHGTPLPPKPVLITLDDGYRDNITYAAPILEKYGLKATVSVIGVSVGKDTYKDTGVPMTPHFALEEAAPYVRRGVLDVQSHSYDMHQVQDRDGEDCRRGVLRADGEDEYAYVEALTSDFLRSEQQLQSALPVTCDVFTYPNGLYDTLSEVVLQSLGVRVTVTTEPGINVVLKGTPQSLYAMKRIDVIGGLSAGELLDRVEAAVSDPAVY